MNDDLPERMKRCFVSDMLAVLKARGVFPEETTLYDAFQITEQHWDTLRGETTARESIPRPATEPPPCADCGAAGEWAWVDDAYGMKKVGPRYIEAVIAAAHWEARVSKHESGCPKLRAQQEAEAKFNADDYYAQPQV